MVNSRKVVRGRLVSRSVASFLPPPYVLAQPDLRVAAHFHVVQRVWECLILEIIRFFSQASGQQELGEKL